MHEVATRVHLTTQVYAYNSGASPNVQLDIKNIVHCTNLLHGPKYQGALYSLVHAELDRKFSVMEH